MSYLSMFKWPHWHRNSDILGAKPIEVSNNSGISTDNCINIV